MKRVAEMVAWTLIGIGTAWEAQAAVESRASLPPQRPVELEKLRAFDGTWQADMKMTMEGKHRTGKARVTCHPAAGGWAELCTMTTTVPGHGTYESVEMFSYDEPTDSYHWATSSNSGQHLDLQLAWHSPQDARAHGQVSTPKGLIDDLATFHWRSPDTLEFQDVTTLDGKPLSSGEGTFHRTETAQSRSAPPARRPPVHR